MYYLFPNHFKKIGVIIAPLGFGLWLSMQWGCTTRMLTFLFGESSGGPRPYHAANIIIAVVSFFSFLFGIYFVTFSKEKVEDEMVQRTRLDSFQFAAFIQIIVIIVGFLATLFYKDAGDAGLSIFFTCLIFLFWLSFLARFNYILHIKLRK